MFPVIVVVVGGPGIVVVVGDPVIVVVVVMVVVGVPVIVVVTVTGEPSRFETDCRSPPRVVWFT